MTEEEHLVVITTSELAAKLRDLESDRNEIPPSILLGAGYDGEKRLAFLEFYDPVSQKMFHYYDKSGHKPYCFTKEPLENLQWLKQRSDVVDILVEEKLDLLSDSKVLVSKILTSDPLAIGGSSNERSIRNFITAYEADIKYYENYLYDNQLQVGSFYSVRDGRIYPEVTENTPDVEDALRKSLEGSTPPLSDYIRSWALLLTQPQPNLKRAAIDVEVFSPVESRIPSPEKAEYQVISVAMVGSDDRKVVYVLERPGMQMGTQRLPQGVEMRLFKTEPELLLSVFDDMLEYPVIITFNGDDFDLPYLYQRALNMQIPKESIPISRSLQMAGVRHGIHIDLYKAFNNKSIQGYAFSNKYSEFTLNGVASGLLGREKVEIGSAISLLPLNDLAYYNYMDAQLTLDLTRFDNSVFMKLFITISRISKMPLEDASRLNVSNWIRSLMIFEHRRWNALVPRREDLEAKGGASSEAVIKGKKYKGGLVVEPKPGVHFDVVVLDFASLYPSLIKVYNLSYETVRCNHPSCRNNVIPETDHWVCRQRKGMTSLLIGSLRDVRVGYFKSLAKRPGLSRADKEFYSVISQALKVFLNASYGVMGYENFALYCLPVAEATAALGRYSISKTIEKARELGVEVLYGDTDSLFLHSPKPNQLEEILRWARKELGIDLEVDKTYRYSAFSSRKKNYLGVYPDGTVEVKGLTGKKSLAGDTPILARVDGRVEFSNVRAVFEKFMQGMAVELPTVTDDLRTVWARVSDASVHKVEDVYMVLTEKGRSLKLSGDHSVYLMDPWGRLRCKPTRSIREGDAVVGVRYIPPADGDPRPQMGGEAGQGEVGERVEGPHGAPITPQLMFFLGMRSAGALASSGPERRMAKGEGRSRRGRAREDGGTYPLPYDESHRERDGSFASSELSDEPLVPSCGRSRDGKRVPDFVWGLGRDLIAAYLRGLFGGDGQGEADVTSFTSTSRTLVEQAAYLLSYFDIDARVEARPGSGRIAPSFVLSIADGSSRRRFNRWVCTLRPMAEGEDDGRRSEALPIEGMGPMAVAQRMALGTGRGPPPVSADGSGNDGGSLPPSHEHYIDGLSAVAEGGEMGALQSIRRMPNSQDVSYDPVLKVKRMRGSCKMYDFSVPFYERFVAGNLPTLLHNSNVPTFIKKAFKEVVRVLSEVRNPDDFAAAKEHIRQMLRNTYLDLKRKEIPLEDLAFHVVMNKPVDRYTDTTPQHVKAALLLQQRGREIKPGDVIAYVKTTGSQGVKPVELAKPEEVDSEKYVEYMRGTFDQLLDSLGYDFDEILGATKLEDFFWG